MYRHHITQQIVQELTDGNPAPQEDPLGGKGILC